MKQAFSLLELMIVIVILGLLSAVILPNVMGKGEEAKAKIVCIQIKNVHEALKSFRFDNGVYPSTEEGLEALLKNPDENRYKNYARTGYLDGNKLPVDPWQNKYIYLNDGTEIDIISLGSDGKEGGNDEGADITLKKCL
jgi:general secretion pathway protein G